jgi:hypothetical protein
MLDTSDPETWQEGQSNRRLKASEVYPLQGRSLVLLVHRGD